MRSQNVDKSIRSADSPSGKTRTTCCADSLPDRVVSKRRGVRLDCAYKKHVNFHSCRHREPDGGRHNGCSSAHNRRSSLEICFGCTKNSRRAALSHCRSAAVKCAGYCMLVVAAGESLDLRLSPRTCGCD